MAKKIKYPTHTQLTLPLLDLLNEHGGSARPADLYQAIGEHMGLSEEEMNAKDLKGNYNLFKRHVRWAKETLKSRGLVESPEFNVWKLTEKGRSHLLNAKPGVFITLFTTAQGQAIWGEALTVTAAMDDDMIDLHFTSPPYPLATPKEYGNVSEEKWLDWFLPLAEEYYRTLSPTGSFVINLGDTYKKGFPTQSIYIEKLVIALVEKIGFHLCGRFYWENPCKPPMSNWVTKDRSRVKRVIEPLFWFSKTEHPKADNRNVLTPYSHSFLKGVLREDFERTMRPAGFSMAHAFKTDNGGSIPGNLFTIPVTPSTDRIYLEKCRLYGVSPHPARMPIELPQWFISFLTEKNDIVCDLMAGSCVTAEAAEKMGRRWIAGEKSLKYLWTGSWRFPETVVKHSFVKACLAVS